jgi:hypothetical protein
MKKVHLCRHSLFNLNRSGGLLWGGRCGSLQIAGGVYNFFAICYQTFCFSGNRFGVTIDT